MSKSAQFIKNARKSYGLTQKEFANKFHVTERTVQNWEAGKELPEVVKMAIELKMEIDGVDTNEN